MDFDDLKNRFEYHAPGSGDVVYLHGEVRQHCLDLATLLNKWLPEGREKSIAITKLEEVMMFSNAAIARNQE